MENNPRLQMRMLKFSKQSRDRNGRATVHVDPVELDKVAEVAMRAGITHMTAANKMIAFAYEHLEWV